LAPEYAGNTGRVGAPPGGRKTCGSALIGRKRTSPIGPIDEKHCHGGSGSPLTVANPYGILSKTLGLSAKRRGDRKLLTAASAGFQLKTRPFARISNQKNKGRIVPRGRPLLGRDLVRVKTPRRLRKFNALALGGASGMDRFSGGDQQRRYGAGKTGGRVRSALGKIKSISAGRICSSRHPWAHKNQRMSGKLYFH